MKMCHFETQNGPFAPDLPIVPFIVQNFKKLIPADPEL